MIEKNFSDKETEIWDFINGDNKIVNPTLKNDYFLGGIGLYIVPFDFCTKQKQLANDTEINLGHKALFDS